MLETSLDRHAAPGRLGHVVDWFKARERPWLVIGASAQLVVLIGMIVLRSIPYFGGQTVLLQVQPVDPRDMFRGDYVVLSYEFSRLPCRNTRSVAGAQQIRPDPGPDGLRLAGPKRGQHSRPSRRLQPDAAGQRPLSPRHAHRQPDRVRH